MNLARNGALALRLVNGARDEEQIAAWLAQPALLEWWQPDEPTQPHDDDVVRCIIDEDDEALGYAQLYPVAGRWHEYGLRADEVQSVWALDLFIGDPSRWGSGIGTDSLSLIVDHVLVDRAARRIVVDPRAANTRALRSYEKVGFRRAGSLPEHEVVDGEAWDCVLMSLDALDHPVGLTAHLAGIDSVNPSLVRGAAGESEVAHSVAAWAAQRGMEVSLDEVSPGRWNVVAVRRGSGGGRSLLLNAHLDTVGPAATPIRLGDGRLEGRGVLDTKGGLAAALLAAASFANGELAGDVIVAGVADEECGSIGTEALVEGRTADAAVVLEPTDLHVVHRHRGFATVTATITGRASHTSRPDRGVNAVHAAAAAITAVAELDRQWEAAADDPVVRPATLVSIVRHDGEMFTVPARCEIVAEIRTTAEGHDDEIAAVARTIGAAVAAADAAASVELTPHHGRLGLGVDAVDPFVAAVAAAVGAATHREPVLAAAPYWTDAALHSEAGTPSVVLGPVGQGLHEDLEWVTTRSLHQCRDALTHLARHWCT